VVKNNQGTREVIRFDKDSTEEPEYELELIERAEGRLVTAALTKRGVLLREMEIYRYRFNESKPFKKRTPYTIEMAHAEVCWDQHDSGNPQVIEYCRCIVDEIKMGGSPFREISDKPIRYKIDKGEEPLPKPVGVATIIYKEIVPPRFTGDETIEKLKEYLKLAIRVEREFALNNSNIILSEWNRFHQGCRIRIIGRNGRNNN